MTFYVGQKVVCLDAEPHLRYMPPGFNGIGDLDGLTEGAVYTVRRVGRRHPADPMPNSLWLEELRRPLRVETCIMLGEAGFDPRRFRPVVERKTDISVFQAMLNPSSDRVSA